MTEKEKFIKMAPRARIRFMRHEIEKDFGTVGNCGPTLACKIISDICFVSYRALLLWYKSDENFHLVQKWKDDALERLELAMCEAHEYNDQELKSKEWMAERGYLYGVYFI